MTTNAKIQFRRDTAANWTAADPTLLSGEIGLETDTGAIKIGDGATAWTSLGYFLPGGSVSDADYGDIVVTSSGTVWSIDTGVLDTTNVAGSALTGADLEFVTGTAGASGTFAEWNGDGDLVEASYIPARLTPQINTQTGTTYTLVLADAGKIVEMNNAGANTLTIPTNASVAFPTGTIINITQYGAGATTIEGDTGVTLNGVSAGSGAMDAQYAGVALYKRGTDEWIAQGGIGTVA